MQNLGAVVTAARQGADQTIDITQREDTMQAISAVSPTVIINLAAMTNVDTCESDPVSAYRINAVGVANIAAAMNPTAKLVQVSTDQVFPDTSGPHQEDVVAPVNAYGASKLAGECAALAHKKSLILRVNFFGASQTAGRKSLYDFIAGGLRSRQKITLFEDVLFSPLHMTTLADLVAEAVDRDASGIYNVASRDGASKAEFGLKLASHLDLSTETARIGKSDDTAGRAHRTKDLRMNVEKFEHLIGRRLPTMEEEIAKS